MQELAAIEIDKKTNDIVDVFHAYAYTEEDDKFSRNHIHGLDKNFLRQEGFASSSILLSGFELWLDAKSHKTYILCNDASKEKQQLSACYSAVTTDFNLMPWALRKDCASHQVAIRFKELSIPILGTRCHSLAHASFICAPATSNSDAALAKTKHGYHCALYDAYELYLECLMTKALIPIFSTF